MLALPALVVKFVATSLLPSTSSTQTAGFESELAAELAPSDENSTPSKSDAANCLGPVGVSMATWPPLSRTTLPDTGSPAKGVIVAAGTGAATSARIAAASENVIGGARLGANL